MLIFWIRLVDREKFSWFLQDFYKFFGPEGQVHYLTKVRKARKCHHFCTFAPTWGKSIIVNFSIFSYKTIYGDKQRDQGFRMSQVRRETHKNWLQTNLIKKFSTNLGAIFALGAISAETGKLNKKMQKMSQSEFWNFFKIHPKEGLNFFPKIFCRGICFRC